MSQQTGSAHLVVREKPNGILRVCLDPRDMNKAIRREHYPKLHSSTLFSRLGAKSAYWNVKLHQESSYLTPFNNHRGRFRYKRMSYVLNSSQYIFGKEWTRLFKGVRMLLLLQITSRCLALMTTMTQTCMKQWRESEVQESN